MLSFPPIQRGTLLLIMSPKNTTATATITLTIKDWCISERALSSSPAPSLCPTRIENPTVLAMVIPKRSQLAELTRPTEAEAWAPKLPTIAASMYCMAMKVI